MPVFAEQETNDVEGTVRISPVVQHNIGVRTAIAEKRPFSRTIRAVGRVDYDEEKTDPEALAECADNLLETTLSTPGIVEEYGEPTFDAFLVKNGGVPLDLEDAPFREDTARQDAVFAFDEITSASYYGFGFKQILIEDAEARRAALILLNRLRFHGAKGLT